MQFNDPEFDIFKEIEYSLKEAEKFISEGHEELDLSEMNYVAGYSAGLCAAVQIMVSESNYNLLNYALDTYRTGDVQFPCMKAANWNSREY